MPAAGNRWTGRWVEASSYTCPPGWKLRKKPAGKWTKIRLRPTSPTRSTSSTLWSRRCIALLISCRWMRREAPPRVSHWRFTANGLKKLQQQVRKALSYKPLLFALDAWWYRRMRRNEGEIGTRLRSKTLVTTSSWEIEYRAKCLPSNFFFLATVTSLFFRIFFLTFTETSRKRSREVGQIMIPAGKQLYICVFGGIFRLIPSRVPWPPQLVVHEKKFTNFNQKNYLKDLEGLQLWTIILNILQ